MEDEKLKAITVFIVIGVFTSTSGLGKLFKIFEREEKPSNVKLFVKTNTKVSHLARRHTHLTSERRDS